MPEPQMPTAGDPAGDEYASTVIAPAQIALGGVSGVAAAVILVALNSALWPVAVLALLLAVAVGIYLAVVSLRVTPGRVTLGQGRGEREQRLIYLSEIVSAQARNLTWAQCFGIGMPAALRSTRLTVRAGSALVLITGGDELIAVSTPNAARALAVLTRGATAPAPTVPSPPVPSYPAPSYPAPSYPAPSYPAPSYPAPSFPASYSPGPFKPSPFNPAPTNLAPVYPAPPSNPAAPSVRPQPGAAPSGKPRPQPRT